MPHCFCCCCRQFWIIIFSYYFCYFNIVLLLNVALGGNVYSRRFCVLAHGYFLPLVVSTLLLFVVVVFLYLSFCVWYTFATLCPLTDTQAEQGFRIFFSWFRIQDPYLNVARVRENAPPHLHLDFHFLWAHFISMCNNSTYLFWGERAHTYRNEIESQAFPMYAYEFQSCVYMKLSSTLLTACKLLVLCACMCVFVSASQNAWIVTQIEI